MSPRVVMEFHSGLTITFSTLDLSKQVLANKKKRCFVETISLPDGGDLGLAPVEEVVLAKGPHLEHYTSTGVQNQLLHYRFVQNQLLQYRCTEPVITIQCTGIQNRFSLTCSLGLYRVLKSLSL